MTRFRSFIFAGLMSCLALPSFAAGPAPDQNNCNVELFKIALKENISKDDYYFFLSQFDADSYSKATDDVKALVPEYFAGSWTEFREKRDKLKSSVQLTTENKYNLQYALSELDETGLQAYEACLKSQRSAKSLSLFRQVSEAEDKIISFVVELQTDVSLVPPIYVDVFGVKRLLSDPEAGVTTRLQDNILHIHLNNLIGDHEFTVERQDYKIPLRVTASVAGLIADPAIEVGPALKKVDTYEDTQYTVSDSIAYLARRLVNGSYDFVWIHDGVSGSNNSAAGFVGNACFCASGQRRSWDEGYQTAGRCIPHDADDTKIIKPIQFSPALTAPYLCGGQIQVAATVSADDPSEFCYKVPLSLNAPDQWGSNKECDVTWVLSGKIRHKVSVFRPR